MWLMDHQMNVRLSEAFGQYFVRLPLKKSPTIKHANALRLDWKTVLSPEKCSYVLGNPPFVGHHYQSKEQKEDQQYVLANIKARGVLDYVTNWYIKAAEYIQGSNIVVAFVSTNSITQGEQVGILWTELFGRFKIKIHLAHRTFPWASEARGKAHVHVVIIGFASKDISNKSIYDYDEEGRPLGVSNVKNISPYLIDGQDLVVTNRTEPLAQVPAMVWGNKPTDGGFFLLSPDQKQELLKQEPAASSFVRRYLGAEELLHNVERWCLWLVDMKPEQLKALPEIAKRVEGVKGFRLKSKAQSTRKYANFPTLFRQIAQPTNDYLAVPEVSSEKRAYIPIAFVSREVICSNRLQVIPGAEIYHFGVLNSTMHMAWMRQICGRLESRYLYSNTIVYNNFPWPEATAKQRTAIEAAAQAVLDARKWFPDASLADLYDPLSMPPVLVKAHAQLDRAVDLCYRPQLFENDRQRVEYLFALYEKLTAPLIPAPPKRRRKATSD
jgi:hypothetical protein